LESLSDRDRKERAGRTRLPNRLGPGFANAGDGMHGFLRRRRERSDALPECHHQHWNNARHGGWKIAQRSGWNGWQSSRLFCGRRKWQKPIVNILNFLRDESSPGLRTF
jgi:hypothetical protein